MLCFPEQVIRGGRCFQKFFRFHDLPDLIQKPGIDPGQLLDLGNGHPLMEGGSNIKEAQGVGCRQPGGNQLSGFANADRYHLGDPEPTDFQ